MAGTSKSSRSARWWRRFGPNALISGVLLLAVGGSFWKTNSDLRGIRQRQDRIEQLRIPDQSTHTAVDDEAIGILESMISDLKEVIRAIGPEDQKDIMEKKLVSAWDILQESKKIPKQDHLDCRRLHETMVEMRDNVDSILHLGWGDSESARKVFLVAEPLARIQSKAGRGVRIAWKEYPSQKPTGMRTERVLGAVGAYGLLSDVVDSVRRILSLMPVRSN